MRIIKNDCCYTARKDEQKTQEIKVARTILLYVRMQDKT